MDGMFVPKEDFVIPPCMEACPAGIDVPRYIRAVKQRKYDLAVAVLREKIPFPFVCADACFAPCEDACAYKQFGDPVAIRALKRTAVDKGGDLWKKNKKVASNTGKKVAIVGSGPAGLTAAYYLATLGHEVTVYDTFPKPGGMIRYGIPKYRVPEQRLDKDIRNILEWGATFKGKTEIGKDTTLSHLKNDFDAIFLASGANGSLKISLRGADKKGVLWGWDFLRDVALGKKFNFKEDLIVVGGGNVAIDVALTAKRLGAESVHLYCLESREEMPAHKWEISRAAEEGVLIHNSWGPKEIQGEKRVKGLKLARCISVFDEKGNFYPKYDEQITEKIEGNTIILAVGQKADLGFVKRQRNIHLEDGRIKVAEETLSTGDDKVFAGGDVVSGPDSIITAISYGRKAASSIDIHLGGEGDISEELAPPEEGIYIPEFLREVKPRYQMPLLSVKERSVSFEQVERGLSEEQAIAEAKRCLDCDARTFEVVVYPENCKECGYCEEVCGLDVFGPADSFNARGYRPFKAKNPKLCVGCLHCFYACPDYAIDIRELRAG